MEFIYISCRCMSIKLIYIHVNEYMYHEMWKCETNSLTPILHGHVEVCNFFLGRGAWHAESSENNNGEIT